RDLAQGEIRVDARILPPDADALEGLDTLTLALDDLDADAHRVAGAEVGDGAALDQLLDLLLLERLKDIHRNSPAQTISWAVIPATPAARSRSAPGAAQPW